jgi:hypothetical protein
MPVRGDGSTMASPSRSAIATNEAAPRRRCRPDLELPSPFPRSMETELSTLFAVTGPPASPFTSRSPPRMAALRYADGPPRESPLPSPISTVTDSQLSVVLVSLAFDTARSGRPSPFRSRSRRRAQHPARVGLRSERSISIAEQHRAELSAPHQVGFVASRSPRRGEACARATSSAPRASPSCDSRMPSERLPARSACLGVRSDATAYVAGRVGSRADPRPSRANGDGVVAVRHREISPSVEAHRTDAARVSNAGGARARCAAGRTSRAGGNYAPGFRRA